MKARKMKIIFALVLLMLLGIPTKLSFAENQVTVSVSSASGKPGAEVNVSVSISNVPAAGISSGNLILVYDTSSLELMKDKTTKGDIVYDKSDIVADSIEPSSDLYKYQKGAAIIYNDNTLKDDGSTLIKRSGVLCNLVFKIKDNAPQSTYEIKPEYRNINTMTGEEAAFYEYTPDFSSKKLRASFTSGIITVSNNAVVYTPTPTSVSTATPTGPTSTSTVLNSATPSVSTPSTQVVSSNIPRSNDNNIGSNTKYKTEITLEVESPDVIINGRKEQLNSKNKSVKPVFGESGVIIPACEIIDLWGGACEWDPSQKKIIINLGGNKTTMFINKKEISINGKTIKMNEFPEIIDNRPYIPLSIAAVSIRCIIEWDKTTDILILKKY